MRGGLFILRGGLILLIVLLIPAAILIPFNIGDLSKADINFDRQLAYLFSRDLGHTLIGTKPMSCEEWFWRGSTSPESKERTLGFLHQVFAKSKNFILRIDTPHPSLIIITLIHKPLLIKTIKKEKYLKKFIEWRYRTINTDFHGHN